MRRISLSILSIAVLLASSFSKDDPTLPGSIRGEVVTVAQNGEAAVSPHARIVLHGPVNKETESDARGAFAVDGLPPGQYNVEASAPGLNAKGCLNGMSDGAPTKGVWVARLNSAVLMAKSLLRYRDNRPDHAAHTTLYGGFFRSHDDVTMPYHFRGTAG